MSAQQYQLFSPAESVEDAIYQIFLSQGIPAQKRFETRTNDTPRVEIQFILGEAIHKKILSVIPNGSAQSQPDDAWQFQLLTTVVTNRTTNGSQHVPLIQKTRYNLQYTRLVSTFTATLSPYHSITNIGQVGQQDSVDDEGNLQMSQITFRGVLNIREDAWN